MPVCCHCNGPVVDVHAPKLVGHAITVVRVLHHPRPRRRQQHTVATFTYLEPKQQLQADLLAQASSSVMSVELQESDDDVTIII